MKAMLSCMEAVIIIYGGSTAIYGGSADENGGGAQSDPDAVPLAESLGGEPPYTANSRTRNRIPGTACTAYVVSCIRFRGEEALCGAGVACAAIGLRTCYTMSGTDMAYGVVGLGAARYWHTVCSYRLPATSGTDTPYAATSVGCILQGSGERVAICYAMPSTDRAYAATRCAVLIWHLLLRYLLPTGLHMARCAVPPPEIKHN
eukprot:239646-Rhodomonas_salina.3